MQLSRGGHHGDKTNNVFKIFLLEKNPKIFQFPCAGGILSTTTERTTPAACTAAAAPTPSLTRGSTDRATESIAETGKVSPLKFRDKSYNFSYYE